MNQQGMVKYGMKVIEEIKQSIQPHLYEELLGLGIRLARYELALERSMIIPLKIWNKLTVQCLFQNNPQLCHLQCYLEGCCPFGVTMEEIIEEGVP